MYYLAKSRSLGHYFRYRIDLDSQRTCLRTWLIPYATKSRMAAVRATLSAVTTPCMRTNVAEIWLLRDRVPKTLALWSAARRTNEKSPRTGGMSRISEKPPYTHGSRPWFADEMYSVALLWVRDNPPALVCAATCDWFRAVWIWNDTFCHRQSQSYKVRRGKMPIWSSIT